MNFVLQPGGMFCAISYIVVGVVYICVVCWCHLVCCHTALCLTVPSSALKNVSVPLGLQCLDCSAGITVLK